MGYSLGLYNPLIRSPLILTSFPGHPSRHPVILSENDEHLIFFPAGDFLLVGGFNPFEKYESKWESSPSRNEHKTYLSCHHLV